MRTPAQHLADLIVGQPIEKWIAARREQDKPVSWRRIAMELRDVSERKLDITATTLMAWYEAASVAA